MIGLLNIGAVLMVSAALQMTVPSIGHLAGAKLPLVLGAVVYYGLTRPFGHSLAIAFWAGLLADALGPMPLGFSTVGFCLVALIAGVFRNLVYEDTWITPAVFGTLGAAILTIVTYVLLLTQDGFRQCSGWWVTMKIMATAMLGVVVTPMMFIVARSMDHVTKELRRHAA